jgi:hypothetical protein
MASRPKSVFDGIIRTEEAETRLNSIFRGVFSGSGGAEVLAYLKSITINRVTGPDYSAEALRHLEGQRFIVGLIDARMRAAEQEQTQ